MERIVGVDVGGTRVRVALRGSGEVREAPTPSDLELLPGVIAGLVDAADAIGVGCAGLIDHDRGVIRWMPHVDGRDVDLAAALRDRLGVPVWVDNDANAATLAEATTGAGTGHRMVLGVVVGTGIGAGLVLDGRLERGRGHLGEVGHMRVADRGDCPCGRVGCWEHLASGRALDRAARSIEIGTDGAWLVDRAAAGNVAARAAIDGVAMWMAAGLANLVLAFDPDVVVLGGIVAGSDRVLADAIRSHLHDAGGGLAITGLPPVVVAAHADRAGLEGAMIGAMEVLR